MYGDLNGKVAIVTGGSKGIGIAIAQRLVSEGVVVHTVSRHASSSPQINHHVANVGQDAEAREMVNDILKKEGGVDILVNNAGIELYSPLHLTDEEVWDRIMDTNVKGAFLMTKYSIPSMLKRGAGVIVNIASVQSFAATKNASAYVTSKHALIGLTKAIAIDYAPIIRAVAVCPASIRTPLLEWAATLEAGEQGMQQKMDEWGKAHPLHRVGDPEEVANCVAFLCSAQASFITGSSLLVDGGLLSRIPISTPEGAS